MIVTFVGANNYVLIENNIFRYTMLSFDKFQSGQATNHIIRKNAFYGEWSASAHSQGLYDNGSNLTVLEDNVFWHNGWRIGARRDDATANGGMVGDDFFRHAFYLQTTTNGVIRRNLIVDGGSDGGQARGDSTITENMYIDNPSSIAAGGGSDYNVARPNGVSLEISYNAILGGADIDASNLRYIAISSANGKSGSSTHHNLIVRSGNPNGVNAGAFKTSANFNQPSYMSYYNNVAYIWNAPGQTYVVDPSGFPSQVFAAYSNNLWDDVASATNGNSGTSSFPNPYTATELYAALGYVDKASFINRAINYPEEHPARAARSRLFAGYGLN